MNSVRTSLTHWGDGKYTLPFLDMETSAMHRVDLVKVGPENLPECGIGCIRSRDNPGYQRKVEWLQKRFDEGLYASYCCATRKKNRWGSSNMSRANSPGDRSTPRAGCLSIACGCSLQGRRLGASGAG